MRGIYDSGSNISLINSRLIRLKATHNSIHKANIKTINGVNNSKGIVKIKLKIFDIEEMVNVFIIDEKNFEDDFLIGLDCISKFQLIQDENLQITQRSPDISGDKKRNYKKREFKIPDLSGKEKNFKINFNEHIDENNFKSSVDHLSDKQKSEINYITEKYKSVFAKDKYDIGTVREYEARIDLIIDKFCSKRPYRCSVEDKAEIELQVAKLLEKKLIEESYSPFAAPVTLAFKKEDGKKSRLCIDFRDINKIVIPQAQPFPLIEDLVVKTRDCNFFSTLDINSAFWSIPLRIEDRYKTAFVTQEGQYQWTCLPFGLKTSPSIFQRILSNIIRKHNLSAFAVNYIDDILIFSKSFEEHLKHLSQLLEAITSEGFRLKFSKCSFAENSVRYLGHNISYNSIQPVQDNLISIRNFPIPDTRKKIRQFLGKINFYNKYVPNISIILDPLHNLLRKDQEKHFTWTQKCQEAFEKVKNLLCSKPILAIFDPRLPIHIYTDASIEGIAAILKQPQNNNEEKPVAYFSRKLKEYQKKKKAVYLECLAIKEAVQFWQHWLLRKKFTVFSDHKPLENMNIKARTDEELGDLTYYLSQYDFQIVYSPGKYNLEADCLSRNPVMQPDEYKEKDKIRITNLIKLEDIINDQEKNEDLQKKRRN